MWGEYIECAHFAIFLSFSYYVAWFIYWILAVVVGVLIVGVRVGLAFFPGFVGPKLFNYLWVLQITYKLK